MLLLSTSNDIHIKIHGRNRRSHRVVSRRSIPVSDNVTTSSDFIPETERDREAVNASSCSYGADYLRTNMMADYLDKLSTDINYITYFEDEDSDTSMAYWNAVIVILILMFMFINRPKH